MKVSIITVCFNSEKTIQSTIESVISQKKNYSDIEYIIIDGGSTDSTKSIIDSYEDSIDYVVSEQDDGIYDAMNKGLSLASGDIVGFLNSDDFYSDEQVIQHVVKTFEKNDVDCVYGDLKYVSQKNEKLVTRDWVSSSFLPGGFLKGWHPPHPTFFVKRSIYEKYGGYDLRYKIASDFDLMYRMLEKHMIRSTYTPKCLVFMRDGGASNKSLKNIIKANLECYNSIKINGGKPSIFFPVIKPLRKIIQIF